MHDTDLLHRALQYIHNSGAALWFEDVPALRDFVFVQPRWLTKLFAVIAQQKHNSATITMDPQSADFRSLSERGVLRLDALRDLWRHHPGKAKHQLTAVDEEAVRKMGRDRLVQMMCHFGVFHDVKWSPVLKSSDPQQCSSAAAATGPAPTPPEGAPHVDKEDKMETDVSVAVYRTDGALGLSVGRHDDGRYRPCGAHFRLVWCRRPHSRRTCHAPSPGTLLITNVRNGSRASEVLRNGDVLLEVWGLI